MPKHPQTRRSRHTPFARFVALGDSQTEGLNDGDAARGYRGWADRLAERLTLLNPDLRYANLAVRGRTAGQVHAEQLAPALALRPDLVTVLAGMNDLLRRRFDAAAVGAHLEEMFAALSATGARVATFTLPDIAAIVPAAHWLGPRVDALNARIRAAANRDGVVLVDTAAHAITSDSRIWSGDRLHANALGHSRIADAMAHALELPGSDDSWTHPLDPRPRRHIWQSASIELQWATVFLAPWLIRRLRGRSSGDGHYAKRPDLSLIDTNLD